jgi:tripartite-type tricarboxylate transporter receptor subunit TctC
MMNRRRSGLLPALAMLATSLLMSWLAPAPVSAQGYPARPVRLIVPFPAGGPADALGRVLADQLNKMWGQPVIVENRGGAGGNIGAEVVARAAPDGYTLLLNASSHVINASLYDKLPYDPIKDFTPVSEVASYMLVLVTHPSVPAQNVKEFVAFAKSKPEGLSVANAGLGTPTHLAAVLFAQAAGVKLVHVPYRGAAPASTDLIAGQMPAMFNNPVNAVPQVKANTLRALAVTGAKRLALLPDTPTIAESGYPEFETRTWYGLFGPAGLPGEIVRKLHADSEKALRTPEIANSLVAQGWDITVSPPERFSVVVKSELDRWSAVVKSSGTKAN